jgi:hypothetical protein
MVRYFLSVIFIFIAWALSGQVYRTVVISEVDSGWAGNSVNAVVFRKNSIVTHDGTQFISFYNARGFVVLGKRKIGEEKWQLVQTVYKGNISDAHNSISIMVDGQGYLHLAWDHHNNALNYCRSKEPLSLQMSEKTTMTGKAEKSVSYPEFFKLANGELLFIYRDGGSGRGNIVVNKYSHLSKKWIQLHENLIDGEGKRNAYWQACTDDNGYIHISWVWRENPDVASNHDMSYAMSKDGGKTWLKSTGEVYQLPITLASAEKIAGIPQRSELINQTSMCTDGKGNPIIASYWKGKNNMPQYQVIYQQGKKWKLKDAGFRNTNFSLSGVGTKKIPISRPQVLSWGKGKKTTIALIFRDEERGNKVSMAVNRIYRNNNWTLSDLIQTGMGEWEPTYDTELWKNKKQLHLFVQKVEQADKEGVTKNPPQMVQVLQVKNLVN